MTMVLQNGKGTHNLHDFKQNEFIPQQNAAFALQDGTHPLYYS